jgi:hypothetical protein
VLRAIPGLTAIRPANAIEVASARRTVLQTIDGTAALILSRRNLPVLDRHRLPLNGYPGSIGKHGFRKAKQGGENGLNSFLAIMTVHSRAEKPSLGFDVQASGRIRQSGC